MVMSMNRKEKQMYEKIANVTDEEKVKEMLSKIKVYRPFEIRKCFHRIGIHYFSSNSIESDSNTNSRILKCYICGELYRKRFHYDRESYLNAGTIAALVGTGSFLLPMWSFLTLLSIPCFITAFYWIAKIAVESNTA